MIDMISLKASMDITINDGQNRGEVHRFVVYVQNTEEVVCKHRQIQKFERKLKEKRIILRIIMVQYLRSIFQMGEELLFKNSQ